MTVARALFELDDSYARAVPGLSVPWTAAPAPAPELLVLNEGLAAELGVDAAALREPAGVSLLVGARAAGRRDAGRAGLRRPPVRHVPAPPRRRPGAAARRGRRRGGPPPRPAPEGVGAHAVRPRRRRQGRGGPDAAGVPDGRGDARPRHPDDARRCRWSPRASGCGGRPRCRARCSAGSPPATCGWARSSTPPRPATATCCARSPTTPSPATTPRPPRRPAVPGAVPRRGRGPGRAGGPVDARRLHPRRDEHRQHDDLRRDHRLRPVRVHGRLRPGHGVQLHRPRRPLRLRQPARRSRSGTSRGSARRCCR